MYLVSSRIGAINKRKSNKASFVKKKLVLKKCSSKRTNEKLSSDKSCLLCGKQFKNNRFLKKHYLTHSDARPHSCDICNKQFKRKYEITIHKRTHEVDQVTYDCEYCDKKLKSKGSWTIHRRRHLKHYIAKCEICEQGFVTKQEYANHVGSKHGSSTHVCNICGRSCYDKNALQSHMARHDKDYGKVGTVKCDSCDKTFLQPKYLKHHYLRVHKNGGQRFVCDLCGKEVNSKRSLRDHMFIHQGVKPIECPECNRSFVLRTTLKQHMRTHTGYRPYQCTECGKSFTQRTPLTVHMRYHTGERPYHCDICDNGFVSKGALSLHQKHKHALMELNIKLPKCIRITKVSQNIPRANNSQTTKTFKNATDDPSYIYNSGKQNSSKKCFKNKLNFIPIVSRYVCLRCKSNFQGFSELNEHLRRPCKILNATCPQCGKVFSNKNKYKAHHKTHDLKDKFPCPSCFRPLPNILSLKTHQDMFHTEHYDLCPVDVKGVKCNICQKILPDLRSISRHINTKHFKLTTFLCDICGKGFTELYYLKAHKITHSDETPHCCLVCEKSFKSKQLLVNHTKTHDADRSFVCEKCGKPFRKKRSLVEHKRKHDGIYFGCQLCGKNFANKTKLNRHKCKFYEYP